jgi:hypothetical protein
VGSVGVAIGSVGSETVGVGGGNVPDAVGDGPPEPLGLGLPDAPGPGPPGRLAEAWSPAASAVMSGDSGASRCGLSAR